MKTASSIALVLLLNVLLVPGAHAVDEGQKVPKLNSAALTSTLTKTLVPLTNDPGNVKGVQCRSTSSTVLRDSQVHFYVDGGSVQSIIFTNYPVFLDNNSMYHTGVIPMNIRFDSSIKIDIERPSNAAEVTCMASWGLD